MEGPKVYSPITGWDHKVRQTPPPCATPTPLPDRLHLALVGKDDGSLQPKLPQTIITIIIIIIIIIIITIIVIIIAIVSYK